MFMSDEPKTVGSGAERAPHGIVSYSLAKQDGQIYLNASGKHIGTGIEGHENKDSYDSAGMAAS